MYNFCFSGNPIFENKKGADEPTKAEVKNMSKKGKIRVALGSLLALTLVVTCVAVYQSGSKSRANEKEFVKENQEDSVDQAIKTEERDEEETEDVNTSDVEGTKTVEEEQDTAKKERADAVVFKEEYETKLKEVDKEAQVILSEARKKAMKTESQIVAEAKEEAARIIARANAEVELEKKRALDEMKQEMVAIASLMAGKVVKASIDTNVQESLIDETLKEMGERTWLS